MNIKNTIRVFLPAVLPLFLFISIAHAQCSGTGCLNDPITFPNITAFVSGALQIIVLIALPVIGFFIVLAGFNFIMAQGNPGKIETAKKNFMYVIIGAGLVLGAWVLATL